INGNVGVWTQITVDEEAGLVYLPGETPTSDYYGGHPPGEKPFSPARVAPGLENGPRQRGVPVSPHPPWDIAISSPPTPPPSAPIVGDGTGDGRPRKVLAVPSKQGWLYVFDRMTGEPVWPIVEKPVPQSDVPDEKTSPTQPHPPDSLRYARNTFKLPDDLVDF